MMADPLAPDWTEKASQASTSRIACIGQGTDHHRSIVRFLEAGGVDTIRCNSVSTAQSEAMSTIGILENGRQSSNYTFIW